MRPSYDELAACVLALDRAIPDLARPRRVEGDIHEAVRELRRLAALLDGDPIAEAWGWVGEREAARRVAEAARARIEYVGDYNPHTRDRDEQRLNRALAEALTAYYRARTALRRGGEHG